MNKIQFLHPKFIPTWILLLTMRLIVFIPLRLQVFISIPFGFLLRIVMTKKHKIAKINIDKCFPSLTKKQQQDIVKNHFINIFMSLFEIANCFFMSKKRLKKYYEFNNKEVMQQLIASKENIIIMVGHFTTMLIVGRILADNFAFTDVYRPQNNKLFDYFMQTNIKKFGINMVKAKDSKNIIRYLKSGSPIWYAPDQDLHFAKSVFAPFFNISTNTIIATAKLAKIANAKVIPLSFHRTNKGYKLNFENIIQDYPSENNIENATKINQILENQIKNAPSQYLWTHRRFKTRPKGEKSFYN